MPQEVAKRDVAKAEDTGDEAGLVENPTKRPETPVDKTEDKKKVKEEKKDPAKT